MTDSMFEQVLDRQLREYADGGVQPFDRYVIAEGLIKSGRPRRLTWLPGLGRLSLSPTMAIVVIGLLLALLAAVVVGALLLRMQLNQPPGRNGVISYALWDIRDRPYNHLHLVNPDGSADRAVAQGTAPVFSFDGSSLAYFTGFGAGEPDLQLVVADADGANAREVIPYLQSGFAYSPDGSQFAVQAGRIRNPDPRTDPLAGWTQGSIWLVSTADGTAHELVPAPNAPYRYWEMVWSPDGKYIAYSVMEEVTVADNSGMKRIAVDVVDVETGDVRRVTERQGTDGTGTAWSPDSRWIAFLGLPDGSPQPSLDDGTGAPTAWWLPEDIFIVGVDGEGETNLTNTPDVFELSPAWSPDASMMAYTTSSDEGGVLTTVALRGKVAAGDPTTGPVVEEFKWSPDATRIAYTRNVETSAPDAQDQTFDGTIRTIDAQLTEVPAVVVAAHYLVGSLNWQRLEP